MIAKPAIQVFGKTMSLYGMRALFLVDAALRLSKTTPIYTRVLS